MDLPEPDPIAANKRRARRRRQLAPDAACALCGTSNLDELLAPGQHLLEDHHGLGRDAAPEVTVVLCRELPRPADRRPARRRRPADTGRPASAGLRPRTVARALASLAVFVHDLAHALLGLRVSSGVACADGLDESMPGWRAYRWAQ